MWTFVAIDADTKPCWVRSASPSVAQRVCRASRSDARRSRLRTWDLPDRQRRLVLLARQLTPGEVERIWNEFLRQNSNLKEVKPFGLRIIDLPIGYSAGGPPSLSVSGAKCHKRRAVRHCATVS